MRLFPFTFVKKSKLNQLAEEQALLQSQIGSAAEFINEIEKGNLEAKYYQEEQLAEQGADDQLGTSLVSLRKQMIKVSLEERQRNWVAETRSKFMDILRSRNNDMKELADEIIRNLVKYLSANQGGLFLVNDDDPNDVFVELIACYAYERKKHLSQRIEIGHGLIGQIILEKESMYLTEIPENYLKITSGLGQANPRHLLIVPLKLEEKVFGAIEIASFHPIKAHEIEFTEQLGESIASTIASVKNNHQTRKLLEETQQQTEEMRAQEEEVRQNMEELSATQEEMQRVMKEVQGNEAFMTGLIDSTNDSIITIDKDYKIISCNKATRETYKASGLEVGKGFDIFDLFTDEQKPKYKSFYDRALQGEFFEVTEKYQYGGKVQYFTVTYSPLKNEKGEIIGAACFGKDVTETISAKEKTEKLLEETQEQAEEMKAQEEEMRQNMEELSATQEEMQRIMNDVQGKEAFMNDLINSTTDTIFAIDKDFNLMVFNEVFRKTWEVQGIKVEKGINVTFCFSKEEWEQQSGFYKRAFDGEILSLQVPKQIGDQKLWFNVIYSPIRNQEGAIIAAACFAKDISETVIAKENAENLLEKFNLVAQTTKEGLWDMVVPEDMNIHDNTPFFWTDRFREMVGYTNVEDFPDVLHSWSDLLHPDHKQPTLDAFSKHLLDFSGKTPYDVEYQLKLKDGSYHWFRAVGNTLRDEKGNPLRIAGSLIDIQPLKDMQSFQEELEKKVEEKTSEVKELLADAQQKNDQLTAQEEEMRQNLEELATTQEEIHRVMTDVQASEHYLNELLNVTQDTIFTMDKEAKIMTFNTFFEASMKKYGFKLEKGFDYMAIQPSEEEKKSQKKIIDKVFAGETIQTPLSYDVEGGEIHLISTYSPIKNAGGKIIAVAVYSKDVTELVMAKKQLDERTWK